MPVFLVRHAHALPRDRWEGDDEDRDLSPKGRRQAELLVPVLEKLQPGRILCSPTRRCLDTVGPVAAVLGLKVEEEAALAEGAGTAALDLIRRLEPARPILCSHGDVIPDLLGAVAAGDQLRLGPHPRVEKASVWVLEPDPSRPGRFGAATHLPPPEPA